MRTDSNTVLSLSSGVVPKQSKSPLAASENGSAFEEDFQKAKTALGREDKGSVAHETNEKTSLENDKNEKITPIEQTAKSLKEDSSAVVLTSEDGKALQSAGDVSPTKLKNPDESIEFADLPLSDALEVEGSELVSGSEAYIQAGLSKADLGEQSLSIEESDLKGDLHKNEPVLVSASSSQDFDGSVLTSLPQNVESFQKDNLVPLVDSEGEKVEFPLEEDGQLSWVLSQMGARTNSISGDSPQESLATPMMLGKGAGAGGAAAPTNALLSGYSEFDMESFDFTDAAFTDSSDTLLPDDLVSISEPIELRKKEQEAMLSRMSGQIDGKVIEEGVSNLNNAANSMRSVSSGAPSSAAPQANLTMNVPPQHPNWATEMSQKVAWVARDGGHTAHIRLDPPELGSLTVKISVDNDTSTQVSFIAATPQARDLLEGQMSRLRDMLAQQGMDLSRADVDVSQQDTSGMGRGSDRDGSANRTEFAAQDEVEEELIANNVSYVSSTGVDYYA